MPASTVAQVIQAGSLSTHHPSGCCRRILTRLACGIAALPSTSGTVTDHTPKSSRCMSQPSQLLKSPMSWAPTAPGAHSRYTVAPFSSSRMNPCCVLNAPANDAREPAFASIVARVPLN